MASETEDFRKDPNLSLSEKWKLHMENRRRTGKLSTSTVYLNRWGPAFYLFTIVGGVSWLYVDIVPTLYAQHDWQPWTLTAYVTLTILAVQVALNWCLMRWVDTRYLPERHGTQPPDVPDPFPANPHLSAPRPSTTTTTTTYPTNPKPDTPFPAGYDRPLAPSHSASPVQGLPSPATHLHQQRTSDSSAVVLLSSTTTTTTTNATSCDKRKLERGSVVGAGVDRWEGVAVEGVDEHYPPPAGTTRCYDGHSFRMLVATGAPGEDGTVERRPFPYWSWAPCLTCRWSRPPRCHHCPLCEQCVLKRDHHCYFVGRCVGLNTYRFFVVFLWWALLLTSFFTWHTAKYVSRYWLDQGVSMLDLVFPLCLLRGLLGYCSLALTPLIMVIWSVLFCNVFSLTMLLGSLHLVLTGRTTFERDHCIKVKDTRSLVGRLRSIFGEYWWLNVLVPTYPSFRPLEDGVLWPHIKPC